MAVASEIVPAAASAPAGLRCRPIPPREEIAMTSRPAKGSQPSSREDLFGSEGIGEDGDGDMGTRGHASQGGTAGTRTGGARGHDAGAQRRSGNPGRKRGPGEAGESKQA
jgi:hypothetical protein